MSLVKKSDVKNHLLSPYRTQIHLCKPESQPDATGFSGAESDTIKADPSTFSEDFVAEHSSSGAAVAPGNPSIGSIGPQAPAASKACNREVAFCLPAQRMHPAGSVRPHAGSPSAKMVRC